MTAYSFKSRFVEPILAGTKGGTIRAARRWRYGAGRHAEVGGHAFPGEELQLYTGMRTKQCRLIARKTCVAVEQITLDFMTRRCTIGDSHHLRALERHFEQFARFDGFESLEEMAEFWKGRPKGPVEPWWIFEGWHIRWLPLPWDGV